MSVWFLKDRRGGAHSSIKEFKSLEHNMVIKFVMCPEQEGKNGQNSQDRKVLELRLKCLRSESFTFICLVFFTCKIFMFPEPKG